MENINNLTVNELQNLLKSNGLPYYYKVKKDLVDRWKNYLIEQKQGDSSISDSTNNKLNDYSEFQDASSDDVSNTDLGDKSSELLNNKQQETNHFENISEHFKLTEKNKKMTENNSFSFRDIEESLSKFDGESGKGVSVWVKEFEQVATMCKWNEIQKYLYARRLMKGSAKMAIESTDECTGWDSLKSFLLKEFAVKVSMLDVHKELENRKKRKNESILEYIYSMKQIAKQGNLDEETIVAYIIQGIPDSPSNKIILYEAKTIETLKIKLKAYDIMKSQQVNKVSSNHKPNDRDYKKSPDKLIKKRCVICGSFSHPTVECPHKSKGSRCFKCNEFGHIAPNCTRSENNKTTKEASAFPVKIIPPVTLKVFICDQEFYGMLDTGSDVTLIKEEVYNRFSDSFGKEGPGIILVGLGRKPEKSLCSAPLNLRINNENIDIIAQIVPNNWLNYDLLLGRDILQNNFELKISSNSVEVSSPTACEEDKADKNFLSQIDVLSLNVEDKLCSLEDISSKALQRNIEQIIINYSPRKPERSCIQMHIHLEKEAPIFQKPRRLPLYERQVVNDQVQQWLNEGIIRPSSSDFASPVVLVKKADGSPRLCIDYRKLNAKVIKDRYPLPIIEEVLEGLYDSKVFTTLDLKNGFFHVDISEESRRYTSFITTEGQYEFLKAPFGLCNSPAVFQRFVNTVFQQLIYEKFLFVYIDDLIIPSKDEAENLEKLKVVLKVAEENGLIIKWSKCKFLQRRIHFLGHIIENGSIRPSDEKVKAVLNFPTPKSVKDVKSFLGLSGFFRKFICNYSTIAKPLTELTKKECSFHFENKEIEAFNALKQCLCDEPVLKLFNPDLETELHADASKVGMGAVLLQKHDNKKFHPVFYSSFKTNEHEQNYSSYELECLAIVKSLSRLRYYLLGIKFKIFTDCNALQQTMKKKELSARVARWALILEEYDCTVHHRSGSRMQHADALSRHPIVLAVEKDFLHQIKVAQSEDEHCRLIIEVLKNVPNYDNYLLKNDMLYRFLDGAFLLVVPKRLQKDLIRSVHEQAHINAKKVQIILKQDYYFPSMIKNIEKVLKNCVPCILAAKKEGKPEGILNMIDKMEIPLHTFHIDHLGPLASTAKNYKYLFVVIDAFTKFSWLFPVKTTSADETVKKLHLLAEVFGNPCRIVSDRGAAFISNAFKSYCEEQKINHILTTTGVPRGNGQVERLNRVIIAALSKMSVKDPTKWYKYVPVLQKFLNSTPSRATGKTPFELLIGVKMKKSEDLELAQLIEEAIIAEFEEKREEMRKDARESILKIQEENRRYNLRKRKKGLKYKLHDLVAVKQTQFQPNAKLLAKFMGPYEVIKVKKNDRYELRKVGYHDGPNLTSSAVDNMKPWKKEEDDSSESDSIQDGRM